MAGWIVLTCSRLRHPGSRALGQTPSRRKQRRLLWESSEINQKEIEEHFQPFVRYVAGKLSSTSTVEGRVVVVPTLSRLAAFLTERKADFYMESPHPTYLINNVYGSGKLLLRRWKGGMADYHAIIFTKKSGDIKRLEDLRGKIIAFEDPESTSGHFLPNYFLSKKGFKVLQKTQIDRQCFSAEKSVTFLPVPGQTRRLGSHEKSGGRSFSNDDYAALAPRKIGHNDSRETACLPRHLVSVRKNLAPVLGQAVWRRSCCRCIKIRKDSGYCKKPTARQSSTSYREGNWLYDNDC